MSPIARAFMASIALAALATAAPGFVASGAQAQSAPRGDAAGGQRLYLTYQCFTCHGRAGQGGAYNGPAPALAKTMIPFDGFLGQLRTPVNDMPAYSTQVLSDQQVADMYTFLQTLPGPRPVKDIPILSD